MFIFEFCIGYVFAIVGMELFAGLMSEQIADDLCNEQMDSLVVYLCFFCHFVN